MTPALLRLGFAILGGMLVCAIPVQVSAGPCTNTVINNFDSGPGSLRYALTNANNGDVITFCPTITGTILLTNGQLMVTKSVTILGLGAENLAVNGNGASRVFYIAPSNTVTISGLTITRGSAPGDYGGGIYHQGLVDTASLTLINCVVTNNSARDGGGVYNEGFPGSPTLAMLNCTVSGNAGFGPVAYDGGGGIYNDHGTTTISNSTVTGNSGAQGGGIYNDGYGGTARLSIIASTLSGNSGTNGGGAIYNDGGHNGTTTLTLTNCTISGNSDFGRAGGIYNDGSSSGHAISTLLNCTLSGNSATEGGSFFNDAGFGGSATITLGNTILKAGASGGNFENYGTITSLGYNLSSDNGGGSLTAAGDQINTDPKLGSLQNNGGPAQTHALLLGSPAFDKGKNLAGSATDQRGFPRTFDDPNAPNASGGDGTDIGAYEAEPSTNTVLNTSDSGSGSLRAALTTAPAATDRIEFAPGVTGNITLTTGELLINGSIVINGPGATNISVNGNAAGRIFHISPGLNVTIAGLTMTNGSGAGGAIYNDHSILTVSNCTLVGNSAGGGGVAGAILNEGSGAGSATLTVVNTSLTGNLATNNGLGGAIFNDGQVGGSATVNITASTFSVNSAYDGGAIYNAAQSGSTALSVSISTFIGNSATDFSSGGGAIYNDGLSGSALLSINASTFSGNSTPNSGSGGGAIYNQGTLHIGDTILKAGASGQNIFVFNSGTVSSLGYNLSSDNGGGWLTNTADQINTDPLLGPLQNNGGPTFTHALLAGSPAIDKGKRNAVTNLGSDTDQRGLPRPVDLSGIANAPGGDGSDIGAFEMQLASTPILLSTPQKLLNGSFEFSFTNTHGATFTVLTSTNINLPLTNWTVLGAPTEISPGYFQYADPQATTQPRGFYRLRWP